MAELFSWIVDVFTPSKQTQLKDIESSNKEALPFGDEVLEEIFRFLDFLDLLRVETVCKGWSRVVQGLWVDVFHRQHKLFTLVPTVLDPAPLWRQLCQETCLVAMSDLRHSLIHRAIAATSTDTSDDTVQSIDRTLIQDIPSTTGENDGFWWSSAGQPTPLGSESLVYQLTAKFNIIFGFCLTVLCAKFQDNSPVYAPEYIRFAIGARVPSQLVATSPITTVDEESKADGAASTPSATAVESVVYTYESPRFRVAATGDTQWFRLPHPVLACGDILRVDLIGKTTPQEQDGLYYVCIRKVVCFGKPLFRFELSPTSTDAAHELLMLQSARAEEAEAAVQEQWRRQLQGIEAADSRSIRDSNPQSSAWGSGAALSFDAQGHSDIWDDSRSIASTSSFFSLSSSSSYRAPADRPSRTNRPQVWFTLRDKSAEGESVTAAAESEGPTPHPRVDELSLTNIFR